MRNELCSTNTPELELINPNLAADGKGGIELLCFSFDVLSNVSSSNYLAQPNELGLAQFV